MPTYSIIIPVYNVEAYLPACLDSVLAQDSASDYEVILVDDGSTDRSGASCDEYAAKHPAFRVIHKPNGGLSAARNAGLDAAQGGYVLFLDSDDLWKPELLSTMDTLLTQEPDMAAFGYEKFYPDGTRESFPLYAIGCPLSGGDFCRDHDRRKLLPPTSACMFLYRRAFLGGLRFEEGLTYCEDLSFNFCVFACAERVLQLARPLYLYRGRREGSITYTNTPQKIYDDLRMIARSYCLIPLPTLANYFCIRIYGVAGFSKGEMGEVLALIEANRDILEAVTGWRMRLARFLYRTLGIYRGGKVYLKLIDFKHFLGL